MPRTSRDRLGRVLPALLLTFPVALVAAGCGGDDAPAAAGSSSTSTPVDDETSGSPTSDDGDETTRTVSAAGVSFAVPTGYTDIDAKDVAGDRADSEVIDQMADRMGVTPDQFLQMMGQVDLLLFSDEGAHGGFLDNINVIGQKGTRFPTVDQLKLQLLQIGAHIDGVENVDSALGTVLVADYTLTVGENDVSGRGIVARTDAGLAMITVTATDGNLVGELGDRIVATLAAA